MGRVFFPAVFFFFCTTLERTLHACFVLDNNPLVKPPPESFQRYRNDNSYQHIKESRLVSSKINTGCLVFFLVCVNLNLDG